MRLTIFMMIAVMFATQYWGWSNDESELETRQVALWQLKLAESKGLDGNEKISVLWPGLRNLGYRRSFGTHSPDVEATYQEIQRELLNLPGHAKYFADALERQRASLKPRDYRGDYHNRRRLYLEDVLPNLPSPETIAVLGKYLYDERDNPPPPKPRSDADPVPSSTRLAFMAIMSIGLRQPPVTKEAYWRETVNREEFALSRTRAWYSKVKEGSLAFSFVGHKVEYRFKPDGTWETTALANPPNDEPEAIKGRDSIEERVAKRPSQPPGRHDQSEPISGIWIIGGLLVAVVIGFLTWRKLRSRLD